MMDALLNDQATRDDLLTQVPTPTPMAIRKITWHWMATLKTGKLSIVQTLTGSKPDLEIGTRYD
jgi:hypothetical protein